MFLIPAVNAQVSNLVMELLIPIGIPVKKQEHKL